MEEPFNISRYLEDLQYIGGQDGQGLLRVGREMRVLLKMPQYGSVCFVGKIVGSDLGPATRKL